MQTITKLTIIFSLGLAAGVAQAAPPPPGYTGCTSPLGQQTSASGIVYQTWVCDQGTVTCWDHDGDGKIDYADPATGKGWCLVSGGNT